VTLPFPHSWPQLTTDAAELGLLSVGINSGIFTRFMLTIFSQYYLRK
jgi:hypothetical protein